MSLRLAYLDNGPTPDRISGLPERLAAAGTAVERFWAYAEALPGGLAAYDGIVLSGSPHGAYEDIPFIHAEHAFIRQAAALGRPMLGLCFGSQILASALCGRDQVFRRARCSVGHKELTITAAAAGDRLMRGVAPPLRMFVWHNDEVRADHPAMVMLAGIADAPNQVWRYRDRPIWGIQGHPEVTRACAAAWMGRSREVLARDGADVDALIAAAEDSAGGLVMLKNFVLACREQAAGS